jgi:membrane protease YdiL (CAAX protease family)
LHLFRAAQLNPFGKTTPQGGAMDHRTTAWIKGHPIEAFFLLAVAIFFVAGFLVIFIIPQEGTLGQIVGLYLGRIGVYSPVLAGMFVSRVIRPARKRVTLARRLMVFLPVWFIAEIIHTASLNLGAQPGTSLVVLIVVSLPVALLPAFAISSAFSGTDGVKQMLSTLIRPRGSIVYYSVALLTFPVIHIVGAGTTNILNGEGWFPQVSQGADLALTVFITFFSVLLFSGGINEESGWRGFAQLRLQAKYSPLVANLILWFLMVIWHIPNDIVQYQDGGYLLVRFGLYPFITILLGWTYNRTKGSILAPAIFHASMNSMNPLTQVFPITTAGSILLVGFAVAVVIGDRMWRRLPEDHPAAYQDTATAAATVWSDQPLADADPEG